MKGKKKTSDPSPTSPASLQDYYIDDTDTTNAINTTTTATTAEPTVILHSSSSASTQFVLYSNPTSTSSSITTTPSSNLEDSEDSNSDASSYLNEENEGEELSTPHSKFQEEWWHTAFSLINVPQTSTHTSTTTSLKFDKTPDEMSTNEILNTLYQVLEQKTIKLTSKLSQFLDHPTVLDSFLSFLSRIPPSSQSDIDDDMKDWPWDIDGELHPDFARERSKELQPTIYSYRIMEMLYNTNPINRKFLETHFEPIVQALFKIFKVTSDGNFYHFKKVFDALMMRYPYLLLDSILYTRQRHPLMFYLLPYIHHSPIMECLVALLTFKTTQNTEEVSQRYVHLHSIGFWDRIFKLLGSGFPCLTSATIDFFESMFDQATEFPGVDHLFLPLSTDPHILDLWDSSLHSDTFSTIEATVSVLHSIIVELDKQPEMMFYVISKTESVWYKITTDLIPFLGSHLDALAHCFSHTQRKSIQLLTLELVSCILSHQPHQVNSLPIPFWKHCVHQFFHHPTALCLPSIYKLLTLVLESGTEEVLQKVLVKQKLIHRLLDVYETNNPHTTKNGSHSSTTSENSILSTSQYPTTTLTTPLVSHPSSPPLSPVKTSPTSTTSTSTSTPPLSPTQSTVNSSPDLRVFSVLLLHYLSIVALIQEPRGYLFKLVRAHSRLRNASPNLTNTIKSQLKFGFVWPGKLWKPPLPQVGPFRWTLDFLDSPESQNLPSDVEVKEEDTWLAKYALNIGLGPYFLKHLELLLQASPFKDVQRETFYNAMIHELHELKSACEPQMDPFDLDTVKDDTSDSVASLALTEDKTLLSILPNEEDGIITERSTLPSTMNIDTSSSSPSSPSSSLFSTQLIPEKISESHLSSISSEEAPPEAPSTTTTITTTLSSKSTSLEDGAPSREEHPKVASTNRLRVHPEDRIASIYD